ncbi:MAG: hypothetical protein AAGH15_28795, partial [Myxococcota bacterium]
RSPHPAAALAEAHLDAGSADTAVAWAERAVRLRRRRAAYRLLLARALDAAGDATGARRARAEAARAEGRR